MRRTKFGVFIGTFILLIGLGGAIGSIDKMDYVGMVVASVFIWLGFYLIRNNPA